MRNFLTLGLLLLASPAMAKDRYDCTMDAPQDVRDFENPARISTIKLTNVKKAWTFRMIVDGRYITVDWPDSSMQLNGKGILIATGPKAFAASFISDGPCLFTEIHCGTLLHYVEQPDRSLSLLLQPIALIGLEDGRREPYKVFVNGRCTRAKAP